MQHLLEHAPGSGGLALWMHHVDDAGDGQHLAVPKGAAPGADSRDLPLWTDGHTLHYAPSFETLPLPVQTGWVAHAVLHVALRHVQRWQALQRRLGDVDLALFNCCADAIVNTSLSHLGWLALPEGAVTLEGLLDQALKMNRTPQAALQEWDVERLYAAVDDRRDGPGARRDGPRAARTRALGQAHARDLRPQPAGADTLAQEAEQAQQWAERLLRGHADDAAFSLLRVLPRDLPRVQTPWEQVLRTVAARALSWQPGPNWSRPARSWLATRGRAHHGPNAPRRPWEPGRTASQPAPRLVVVLDVSGSIEAPLLQRLAAELGALTRRLGANWVLVVGDDQVRAVEQGRPDVRLPDLAGWTLQGGGGTDFTPLLQEAARHAPDLTVVLTDLQGPAQARPPGQVLWAVPAAFAETRPPFGRLLVLR